MRYPHRWPCRFPFRAMPAFRFSGPALLLIAMLALAPMYAPSPARAESGAELIERGLRALADMVTELLDGGSGRRERPARPQGRPPRRMADREQIMETRGGPSAPSEPSFDGVKNRGAEGRGHEDLRDVDAKLGNY